MTEKEFQGWCEAQARLWGWLAFHPYDSRRSTAGFPDLCIVKDRVVFAELKTDKGQLTPAQMAWANALQDAGAEWYLWRPSMQAEIAVFLSGGRLRLQA